MRKKIVDAAKFAALNIHTFLLLLGLVSIIIGAFLISVVYGFLVMGGGLILLAILIDKSFSGRR